MAVFTPIYIPGGSTTIQTKQYVLSVHKSNSEDKTAQKWTAAKNGRWKIVVPKTVHNLEKPYIDDCIIDPNTGTRSKSILGMKLLTNGSLLIYSDINTDCIIILKGD